MNCKTLTNDRKMEKQAWDINKTICSVPPVMYYVNKQTPCSVNGWFFQIHLILFVLD